MDQMQNQPMSSGQSAPPSASTRLVLSIILTLVGIGLFFIEFAANIIVAWIVVIVGILSIIYNVMAMRAKK